LQAVPGLARKRTDYGYDMMSGKVITSSTSTARVTHRYQYDTDNRLTGVLTSSDGFLWNREARYQVLPARSVGAGGSGREYRVQAQDYYTLQGWIKGVNMLYAGGPVGDGIQYPRFESRQGCFCLHAGLFTG